MFSAHSTVGHLGRRVKRNGTRTHTRYFGMESDHILVVGLGNPGARYKNTRHNLGFDVIDKIAQFHDIEFKKKFQSNYGEGVIYDKKIVLVKPLTYMNLSGFSVKEWFSYLKIRGENCYVFHDAADIEFGRVKIKFGGRSGGQNGIKSIITELKNEDFWRIKLGIGKPQETDLVNHVLSKWSSTEIEQKDKMIEQAFKYIEEKLKVTDQIVT